MSYLVVSSFENTETGDLQAQGEALAVFASEALARDHFTHRTAALEAAAAAATAVDSLSTFIAWVLILQMPLEMADVDEALEDLETVIEETDVVDDPFGELVVAYHGVRHSGPARTEHALRDALKALEAWLT